MVDKKIGNPLEELYTDATGQVDLAELAHIMKPFIRIHRETGSVIFTPAGMALATTKKLVLLFLAKKAVYLLGSAPTELISPKEVKAEFGKNIPPGTIDATLKRFSDSGLLRSQNGKYFIPDFNFSQVKEIFIKTNE